MNSRLREGFLQHERVHTLKQDSLITELDVYLKRQSLRKIIWPGTRKSAMKFFSVFKSLTFVAMLF